MARRNGTQLWKQVLFFVGVLVVIGGIYWYRNAGYFAAKANQHHKVQVR